MAKREEKCNMSSVVNHIKVIMEKSNLLRPAANWMKRKGIVKEIHKFEGKLKSQQLNSMSEEFNIFYLQHKEDYISVYRLLEDEISKRTYKDIYMYLCGRDRSLLRQDACYPQYFLTGALCMESIVSVAKRVLQVCNDRKIPA